MCRAEKDLVSRALSLCSGNKAEAARKLGINRTTLWRIIKKYNLEEVNVAEMNGVAEMNILNE